MQDSKGEEILEDPKLEKTHRYKSLCQKFACLATKAADFEESYVLLDSALDSLNKGVEEKIHETEQTEESPNGSPSVSQQNSLENLESIVAGLKKRPGKNRSTRPKDWVETMQDKAEKKRRRQAKSTQQKANKRFTSQRNEKKSPIDNVRYSNNKVVITL